MAGEAELAFVATMRDEASAVAKQARRSIESATGTTSPITVPLRAQDGISGSLRSVATSLDGVSRKATEVGGKLTRSLTLPILGAGVAVGKVSIDFSRGMGDVASLLPGNTQRINELRNEVLRIGPAAGASLGDVSRGLYQTLSAFGDTADTAKILENNAKAARAGAASVADAIALTSAVTKSYGDTSAKAVGQASDLALLTVRMGQTTFPELAGSIGLVTPLTKALGASQEELFATMATFTGVTGGASEVSTQLRGALQGLMAPTADAAKAIDAAGYSSGRALVEQEGLAGAIEFLVGAAEKSGKPLQAYIGSIEGQTLALGLAGAQGKTYRKNLEAMGDAAGTTDEAFRSSTTGVGEQAFAWDQAKVKAEKLLVTLGDGLGPATLDLIEAGKPLVEQVSQWAQSFADASPQTQQMVVKAIALTAALGPLVTVVGKLGTGVAGTIRGISSIAGAFARTAPAAADLADDVDVARTKTSAFGRAGRIAAGAAGIGALIGAATSGSDELSGFGNVAGGALLGFAAGGPIGLALGGGAALLGELATSSDTAGDAVSDLEQDQYDLRNALNQTTGAITRQAEANVRSKFAQDGVIDAARILKIREDDLIGSALGREGAQRRVNAALRDASAALRGMAGRGELTDGVFRRMTGAMDQVRSATGSARREFRGSQREIRTWNEALEAARKAAESLPKRVATKIQALGTDATVGDLKGLQKRYDLTPRQIATAIRATGTQVARKNVQEVAEKLEETKRIKGDLSTFVAGITAGTKRARGNAEAGGKGIREGIEKPVEDTRANLDAFGANLGSRLRSLEGTARSGGDGIGSAMGQGVVSGIGQYVQSAMTAAANLVGSAIRAGHNRARTGSPSKETRELGEAMGDGLVVGLRARTAAAGREASRLTGKILGVMLRDLVGGEAQIGKALGTLENRISTLIGKRIKNDRKARRRTADAMKDLRGELRAVRENGAAYDALGQRIKNARQAGVEFGQSLRAYASVASFQAVNDAPVTAGFLARDLEDRLETIQAFAADLARLRERGVSDQVIRDLEAQGVEAGGASAAALAAATDAQLREINQLTGQIRNAAEQAGSDSSRGLIRGLTSDLRGVEAAGRRLAKALRKAIRKELGIKSPSRRLHEDGVDTVRGLARGILDEAGAAESAALVLAERVAAAAVPTLPDLARLAQTSARIRPTAVRSSEVLVIRHEVTSPDGALDNLTAEQVADLIARDPKAARSLEGALHRWRARAATHTITASD